jgi:dienelactone hydrolase
MAPLPLLNNLEERTVNLPLGPLAMPALVGIPAYPVGLVLFVHSKGGSRHSRRNRFVAQALRDAGLVTALFDLLSPEEDAHGQQPGQMRFNIGLLAERLEAATAWLTSQPEFASLPVGFFGASTGVAAALRIAAHRPTQVAAVVSRGGRPDLAGEALAQVRAPTLLLVGGDDLPVLGLNQFAFQHLGAEKRLDVIPGASHTFEEPGALEVVAARARDWLHVHLSRGSLA